MSNISSGDFGCCGSYSEGCAVDKGCAYGNYCEDELDRQEMLLYAMDHCNVFKKIFLQHDEAFIKTWKSQINEDGTVNKPRVVYSGRTCDREEQQDKQLNDIVGKLTGKFDDTAITDLLKLLGL